MTQKKLTIWKVFWQHVAQYKWEALLITIFFTIRESCDLVMPILFKNFIDTLTGGSTQKRPILLGILALIALLFVGRVSFRFCGDILNNRFQPKVMAKIIEHSFRSLIRHSYQFFVNNFSGSLVRKVQRLSFAFEAIADTFCYNIIPLVVTFVGSIGIVWFRSRLIAALMAVWMIVIAIINFLFNRAIRSRRDARAAADSEATGVLADSIGNSLNSKLFPAFEFEEGLVRKIMVKLNRLRTRTWDIQLYASVVQVLCLAFAEVTVLYLAIGAWFSGRLTIGDFVLLQMLMSQIWATFWSLNGVFRTLGEATADGQEMVNILNTPYEIKDLPGAAALKVSVGAIDFEKVRFSYASGKAVLTDFSLAIRPKEKVALVGSSGAGKSTIVKLLFRFFDLTGGKILIDGQDIAEVTQESLRKAVSLVPQEPILFHRSLMENIRYGRRNASDAEVYEAAKKAHCHEFISALPEGYKTLVGERGVKLSGGERQRVAIARAILKDAPILVLDEATSSLDSESEQLIHEALHELMKDKTVIVIAHRLSTIMEMDRIVVIDGGRIVDQGTHETLLKKRGGIYKKLWEIQAGGFIS